MAELGKGQRGKPVLGVRAAGLLHPSTRAAGVWLVASGLIVRFLRLAQLERAVKGVLEQASHSSVGRN